MREQAKAVASREGSIQNVAGVLVAASPVGSIKSTEFSAHATMKLISLDVNDAGWAHPRRMAEKA